MRPRIILIGSGSLDAAIVSVLARDHGLRVPGPDIRKSQRHVTGGWDQPGDQR
ncbi:hypothetical protein GLS40_03340 [Pseudooceanicola sp. 216_PA32_1]|uniref:Uncharacterized protein n=1 Tax=Pseudooceanicola pacificus TaxID=2676438 RepID=A0A844W2X7_9RHOB|nr:hypothetical protein [Pseudooceanicola pacificus]MWB77054.1 hypothetical protein [Pseudooceanicola pacificus]